MHYSLWKKQTFFNEKRSAAIVFLVLIYYLATRLSLILRFGDAAFGYDTGIYRAALTDYATHGTLLPAVGGFTFFFVPLVKLGIPIDTILYGWYCILALLLFIGVYTVAKRFWNERVAVWSTVLFAFSSVQFSFFWWYYYRNLIAVVLLLGFLLLFQKRSYYAILPLALIGVIHPLSLIPIGLTLIMLLHQKETRRYIFQIGMSALIIVCLLTWRALIGYAQLTFHYGGQAANATSRADELTGQFLTGSQFWRMALLYGVLGVIGLVRSWQRHAFFVIFLLANVVLIAIGFLLYRRFFVFIDLLLIFGAADTLSVIATQLWTRWFGKTVLVLYVGVLALLSLLLVIQTQPLINPAVLENIKALAKESSPMLIVSYDTAAAPWLYGFSGQQIAAPGLFEVNQWSEEDWHIFWNSATSSDRTRLLSEYNAPYVFVYLSSKERRAQPRFMSDPNVIFWSDELWRYSVPTQSPR